MGKSNKVHTGFIVKKCILAFILQISNGFLPSMMSEADFQSMIINTQYQKEEIAKQAAEHITGYDNILIVCDRGICDNQAYMSNSTYLRLIQKYFNTTKSEVMGRYGAVFHLVTAADGAEEFYTLGNNSARSETPEQARELDRNTRNCWIGHPHLRIIKNDCNFEQNSRISSRRSRSFSAYRSPMRLSANS